MTPTKERSLDLEVISLLEDRQTIHAIKLLRERDNLSLKEAKKKVDDYLQGHPELELADKEPGSGNAIVWIVLVGLAAAAALAVSTHL
ncbi:MULTISPECIES: hypothetical protein [Shewanella]|jgi:hypothetical protein|uniref:hypothetical protein n=2 Tax=Shewanellaceae TaxID=267890 RepID=UPI000579BDFB|nr:MULTISPECIES: hypothetical protein [Shewanella]MCE9791785.1 hypothetical protein [Shewanella indica]OIN17966.1 hypothetical protein BFS86_03780 [Shewanella algae]TVP13531.1 hypothetical protein AYI96_02600 [Shewanella sp. MSW]GHB00845.1 hypothetical protein GCM10007107_12170 [Shewanella indica]